jgi:cell division inhibitor SulA
VFLDLQHETFAELIRDASLGLVRAAKFGQADPLEVASLVHGDGEHRAAHLAFPVVFDYYHQGASAEHVMESDVNALRRAATRSTFGWLDTAERENLHLYIKVIQFAEEAEIVFWIDTRYVSRADLAGIAWGAERLIIEAVAGPIKLSRISAVTGVPEAREA